MPIKSISVDDIFIEKSRFSLDAFLFEPGTDEACPAESFKHLGILQPVVVYRESSGQFHLIDGKKRIRYARQSRSKEINAIVLAEKSPVTDIITLILCERNGKIKSGIMNKVRFICFALSLHAPESWILEKLCMPLGFKPYSAFLRDCEAISKLPEGLQQICHEKKFSFKQILNLTHYPHDILTLLITWKPVLQLTASILDEMASNLKDYLKARNTGIENFLAEPGISEIINSGLSPRDKTERLRRLIYLKQYPVLSEVNAGIHKTIRRLNLPEDISIEWDRTLENKCLDFTIHMQGTEKWQRVLDTLNSEKLKKAIESILDKL
ncbi:MAG TPA: hypothetical protein ENG83_07900 [Nitrospirae bacterium]|nr:nucleoid occlusion protein [bacterium BMS3Abin06]HDH12104.1 hypothetical protein [Nitrospirota bacterium]HDZ03223.1 hypothetical protein [Nitrospirota bacterium]